MPTIVHFEIPSDDTEVSKKFYNELFGCKFDKWPSSQGSEAMPEGMEYWLISTMDDIGGIRLDISITFIDFIYYNERHLGYVTKRVSYSNCGCCLW